MSVHYGYDDKGRLTGERQTVENPETGEMLWEHETGHAYSEQGLATRQEPDGLPPVEWLTYGSGYLAGMKLAERRWSSTRGTGCTARRPVASAGRAVQRGTNRPRRTPSQGSYRAGT